MFDVFDKVMQKLQKVVCEKELYFDKFQYEEFQTVVRDYFILIS